MPWLYKQKNSSKWWIGYRANGKQVLKSTKTSDRKIAEAELEKYETMLRHSHAGTLTDELVKALTGNGLPKITLWSELDDWLAECKGSTAEKTYVRYEAFAKEFRIALNASPSGPLLSQVTTDEIRRFLNVKRAATSAGTANLVRKTLSAIFLRAVRNHHLRENPVSPIKAFKALKGEKVTRRAYSLDELRQIYTQAPTEFWRYMVVGEFYSGLRMGDLICLTVGAVDLGKDVLKLRDDKTDKVMLIPLAKPLRDILASILGRLHKAKTGDYLWPEQAGRYQEKGSGVFSSEFYKLILQPLGLVKARKKSHAATGKGHKGKRRVNEVSFHSIRHSFVTFLRSTGSNQAVAKELAGHASDAMNSLYTHVPEHELSAAINRLPEFSK